MGIFISVGKTIECVVTAVVFTLLFSAVYLRPLGILQQGGYSGSRLFKWSRKKNNAAWGRYCLLFMLCALSCAVVSLCFSFANEWAAVASLSAYVLFFVLYYFADKKVALRSPATFTPRLKRLYTVSVLVTAIFVYLTVTLLNFADFVWGDRLFNLLRYCPLAVYPLLALPILALCNLLAKVYEIPHNRSFVRAAKKKIETSGIKIIGITGSYGKTSVKQILSEVLSQKYRVLSTPRSHNTPMGLALCINNNDLDNYDILIAEMGARNVGDIAELCELCPPDYSVITGICPQHLESFGSEENIVKAKGEILSATKTLAVVAPGCFDKFSGYPVKKVAPECISDVECTCAGTSFLLTLGGESVRARCVLLGRHSAENIALAAQLAHELGMTAGEIAAAVGGLGYVEHRLQLIKSGGVNILDDGYNSNVRGAAAALEVLGLFGGRKIVVTPGLVELGILEESENYLLGKQLAGLDYVILVGDTLITPVKKGYLENGGDASKMTVVPYLSSAREKLKEYLREGDSVLFLNDLPDIY